jgi:hypothetical protein
MTSNTCRDQESVEKAEKLSVEALRVSLEAWKLESVNIGRESANRGFKSLIKAMRVHRRNEIVLVL